MANVPGVHTQQHSLRGRLDLVYHGVADGSVGGVTFLKKDCNTFLFVFSPAQRSFLATTRHRLRRPKMASVASERLIPALRERLSDKGMKEVR